MKILAIDTTAVTAAAALVEDGQILGTYQQNGTLTHSETMLNMVENLLANALIADGDGLYGSQIYGASSFESLITATLCRHQDAVAIHSDFCDVLPSDFPVNVEVLNSPPFEEFEV